MSAIRTLEVRLHDFLAGHLTRYPDEKTVFTIDQRYVDYGRRRPMLSLSMARPDDEDATRLMLQDERHKTSFVKAPPTFSNLLPEGALRARIAAELKVHEDREFDLLAALGADLPGALMLLPADTPAHLQQRQAGGVLIGSKVPPEMKFSLGGMQIKFSMLRQGQRFTLPGSGELGDFIIKPPSAGHEALPLVEAATMAVAKAAGIDVPEVMLVKPRAIEGLAGMSGYPRGEPFYAIRRFDRVSAPAASTSIAASNATSAAASTATSGRVHTEDFAQVFNLRANQKYGHANYDQIARTLLRYGGGLEDVREMTRRLMLNLLIGNGDAHVKNWSLIYDNPQRPRLAPAYDLVSTVAYTTADKSLALNMNRTKAFASITLETFDGFLARIGVLDQTRRSVMASTIAAGQTILETWEASFKKIGVPVQLMRKIRAHQKMLPIIAELAQRRVA